MDGLELTDILNRKFPQQWPMSALSGEDAMQLSARNQLDGRITKLQYGSVMAEVTIDIGGGNSLVSVITRTSAEHLNLREGDQVVAVIKSTEIIVGKT